MPERQQDQPGLVVGVDGGNTKTIAIVATAAGEIVGAGRAGCADIYNAPDEATALREIEQAVESALTAAGATRDDLAAGAFSIAGADWPEDINLLQNAVDRLGFGRTTRIFNDAIGALRAGPPDGIGVSITCGTGVAIGARAASGETWYSGNWAIGFGGGELGREALQAVFEAHLGLAPATALTPAVLAAMDVETVEEVLYRITARGATWNAPDQARLAPMLLDQAAAGDSVACGIVTRAGMRNADVAMVAARAVGLGDGPFRLVLNGGVLRHPSLLLERAIRQRIERIAPGVEIISDPPEPVIGAILLALDVPGAIDEESVRARLRDTMPGPELFAT